MNDYGRYRRDAIRYWEWRRLVYNLALIGPAIAGYLPLAGISAGIGDPQHPGKVACMFAMAALGANVCYSFIYAFEFICGSDDPESPWLSFGRNLAFISGTIFAMVLAFGGGQSISIMEARNFQ
jgi:hypothetical protein